MDRLTQVGLAGVLTTLGLVLSDLLCADRYPLYRDILVFVLPLKAFLAEHLRNAEIPLWNPWIYMGTPFLGGLQTAVFYPLNPLLLLPFPLGFNLFLFAHYLIAATGTFVVLRYRGLSALPAAAGSIVFAAGGVLVSLLGLIGHLQSAVWIPWLMFSWGLFLEQRKAAGFVATTLLVALQILGGSPEITLLTIGLMLAWTVAQRIPRWRRVLESNVLLLLSVGLACLLTAGQLATTIEYVAHSQRSSALHFAEVSYWSLSPISFFHLFLPHSSFIASAAGGARLGPALEPTLPYIHSFYIGLVPLCLLVVGLCVGRERLFWGTVMLLGTFLALGHHTPLFPALYESLPGIVGRFRYPEKFLFIVHVGATVMVAEGAEAFVRESARAIRIASTCAALMLALGTFLYLLGTFHSHGMLELIRALTGAGDLPLKAFALLHEDLTLKSARLVLILASFLVIVLLWGRRHLRAPLAAALVAALISLDLISANRNLNLSIPAADLERTAPVVDVAELRNSRQRIFHYQTVSSISPGLGEPKPIPGLAQWRNPLNPHRDLREFSLISWRSLFLNLGMVHGVGTVVGFDGIERRSSGLLLEALSVLPRDRAIRLLSTLGVAYLIGVTPLDAPDLDPVTDAEPLHVYRLPGALPWAYLVGNVREAAADVDAINMLVSPGFEPGAEAVVPSLPPGWRAAGALPAGDRVVRRSVGTAHGSFDVHASRPAFLVINESYFPGWEATVDGVAAPVYPANVFVRGVFVPPGTHRVEMSYSPRTLRLGAWISFAGAVTLAIVGIVLRRSRGTAGDGFPS